MMGVPFFGQSFTLADPTHHKLGDAAIEPGLAGHITQQPGVLSYYEICTRSKYPYPSTRCHIISRTPLTFCSKFGNIDERKQTLIDQFGYHLRIKGHGSGVPGFHILWGTRHLLAAELPITHQLLTRTCMYNISFAVAVKSNNWKVERNPQTETEPYAYRADQWVGYDDKASLRRKVRTAWRPGAINRLYAFYLFPRGTVKKY